jgi:hypothetical protein
LLALLLGFAHILWLPVAAFTLTAAGLWERLTAKQIASCLWPILPALVLGAPWFSTVNAQWSASHFGTGIHYEGGWNRFTS